MGAPRSADPGGRRPAALRKRRSGSSRRGARSVGGGESSFKDEHAGPAAPRGPARPGGHCATFDCRLRRLLSGCPAGPLRPPPTQPWVSGAWRRLAALGASSASLARSRFRWHAAEQCARCPPCTAATPQCGATPKLATCTHSTSVYFTVVVSAPSRATPCRGSETARRCQRAPPRARRARSIKPACLSHYASAWGARGRTPARPHRITCRAAPLTQSCPASPASPPRPNTDQPACTTLPPLPPAAQRAIWGLGSPWLPQRTAECGRGGRGGASVHMEASWARHFDKPPSRFPCHPDRRGGQWRRGPGSLLSGPCQSLARLADRGTGYRIAALSPGPRPALPCPLRYGEAEHAESTVGTVSVQRRTPYRVARGARRGDANQGRAVRVARA